MSIASHWGDRVRSSQLFVSLKSVYTYVKPRGHISEFAPEVPKSTPLPKPEIRKEPVAGISSEELRKFTNYETLIQELQKVKGPDCVTVNKKTIFIKKSEFAEDEIAALFSLTKDHGIFIWYK